LTLIKNKDYGLQIQSNSRCRRRYFRDIAILADDTLEDLHNAIFNSFGFDGMEVAPFYLAMKPGIKKMKFPFLIQEMFLRAKNHERLQTI
jgi:hypothetical protein